LHTGEPTRVSEGYVGIDVHQVARVMNAAHGEQVLLSQTTRDLVVDRLPYGVSLRDMGEHRLKDLQRPSHLFQLVIEGLLSEFPPLKTLNAYPNNLPVQVTSLIGREKEIAALSQLLQREDVRLVTLTGPGGIGKTRLALQVAAELSDQFANGLYFVDLASLSEPADVIPAIGQTLGLREEEHRSPIDVLKEKLNQQGILLLLDNFEQVISAAVQVANLLAACPMLKMIVTSREVLRIRGEYEFAVPPLSLPDPDTVSDPAMLSQYESVSLFVQCTTAVKPNFQLTKENAPVIARIVTCLDGLPLAIELAAARMKLLSPEALLARLGQRLQVLTGGTRDTVARQQTLRNTIEWSYNLLNAEEQKLFRMLAVFADGCVFEAIEQVCVLPGENDDVLAILASLLDKSLIRRKEEEESSRFSMLETIREYGLEMLAASGEQETVREAWAAYLLEFVEQANQALDGTEYGVYLKRLDQEHDNIRSVMQWLLEEKSRKEQALRLGGAMRAYWYGRGYFSEGRDFLEQALQESTQVDTAIQAQAIYAAARLNEALGDLQRTEILLEQCLRLYQTLGNTERVAYSLHLQADVAWRRGNLTESRTKGEEALALFENIGDRAARAVLLSHLGVLAIDQADYTRTQTLLEESLAINKEFGDTSSIADDLFNLARMYYFSGRDLEQARKLLEESYALYSSLDDKESIAYCLHLFGLLDFEQGHIESARTQIEQSLKHFQEMRQRHGTALATASLAKMLVAQGEYARANDFYRESMALATSADDKLIIAPGLEGLVRVAAKLGQYEKAARLAGAAEALRKSLQFPMPVVERAAYLQTLNEIRASLGTQIFDGHWASGQEMDLDQVLQNV
jgi:predicted ATPase